MKTVRLIVALLAVAALAAPVTADAPAIGSAAPAFDLKSVDGKPFSLADFVRRVREVLDAPRPRKAA